MIKEVNIQNFQSHADTTLKFHKGMNVIVGDTDSGKTAIIRALRLVIWNRPGGDAFRSNWGGDTSVRIKTDQCKVTRSKIKSTNLYQLNKTEFKAFGTQVPKEIKEALNFEDINLQQQLDSPFLITETSGNVAAHFNKIAKLDKIDRGLLYIQKNINSITQLVKFTNIEVDSKKEELNELPNLIRFEKEVVHVESMQGKKRVIKADRIDLINLHMHLEGIAEDIEDTSTKAVPEKEIDAILVQYTQRETLRQNYTKIKLLSIKVFRNQERIKVLEKQVLAEKGIDNIFEMYQKREKSLISKKKLEKVYVSIQENKKAQENTSFKVSKAEAIYKKNFPDVCPLCDTSKMEINIRNKANSL